MKEMRKLLGEESGFTLVELAIGLVIIGLLIGAILGGAAMIKNAKIRRQATDLQGLYAACYTYFDKFEQLPGDRDGNGQFDADSTVWNDLQTQNLAQKVRRSPFGGSYMFGWSDDSTTYHKIGNYVDISIPSDVAGNIDKQLDDGVYNSGNITASADYTGQARVDLYYFID
ncbi:MAG TPA: type II secretion system protein [Terriglobales bacterium]|nr:type II secretion system protein [Terriglobales bacterium]